MPNHPTPNMTKGPPGLIFPPRVWPCWGQGAHQAHAEGSGAWSLTCLLGRAGPAAPTALRSSEGARFGSTCTKKNRSSEGPQPRGGLALAPLRPTPPKPAPWSRT